MLIEIGQIIRTGEGVETRWRVADCVENENLTYTLLDDTHPDIQPPMRRQAIGVCLNTGGKQWDEWQIKDLRRQLQSAFEDVAVGNFPGLPVILDFFEIRNTDNKCPEELKNVEPFMVYDYPQANFVKPMGRKGNFEWCLTLGKNLAFTLKSFHQKECVLRQLDLDHLRILMTSNHYVIAEFLSMARMGPSLHEENFQRVSLQKVHSAPECFDPKGELTPSTDVYVLAKCLMRYLGATFDGNNPFPSDISQQLAQIEKTHPKLCPDYFIQFLKTSMQIYPSMRFQTMDEAICRMQNKDFTRKASPPPAAQGKARKPQEQHKPRAPKPPPRKIW